MYRVRVDKETIRNHFHYDKWKYVLGIVLTIFSWSMLATVTKPQTPPEKKVDIYLVGGYMMEDAAKEYGDTVCMDFPGLREVNLFNIGIEGDMEYAGRQKLTVMLGSQSGDIYAFPKDEFKNMAKGGAFLPLDDYTDLTGRFTKEQLAGYTFSTEDDKTPRVYGVPASDIQSLSKSVFDTKDSVLAVTAYSKNSKKAVKVLEWMEDHKTEEQYQQRRKELLEEKEQQKRQKEQKKKKDR